MYIELFSLCMYGEGIRMKKRRKKKIDWMGEVIIPIFVIIGVFCYFHIISYIWLIYLLIGAIVFCVIGIMYATHKKKKLRRSGIDVIDKMSGEQFENYLKCFFEEQGYKVKTTPKTGDYGCDLLLKKAGKRIAVQAKRYSEKVGIKAVQEVIGSIKYYKADSAMVITNNYFTQNAVDLANSNQVKLWDRDVLISKILYSEKHKGFVETGNTVEKMQNRSSEYGQCPRCGKNLVKRNGKHGEFIGCSGFPYCRFTKNM